MGKEIKEINTVADAHQMGEISTITFAEAVSIFRKVKVSTDHIDE